MATGDSAISTRRSTGWIDRMELVMNSSSAVARSAMGTCSSRTSMPAARAHSITRPRVTPASGPRSRPGVRTTPSVTTKVLEPVPSHRSPSLVANRHSVAPTCPAASSITAFSAYEVVFRPVTVEYRLRRHGPTATVVGPSMPGSAARATM